MVGGLESPGGPKPPGVEGTPQGDKPCGVTPEGYVFPGGYGQGWLGDKNSPSTQDTKGTATKRELSMESIHGVEAQLHPQRYRMESVIGYGNKDADK